MNQQEKAEDKPRETHKAFLSSGEVARLLGCSTTWVNNLIYSKELSSYRIGSKGWHRITAVSLEMFAERNKVTLDWELIQ